jgi:hypothetical protein
MAAKHGVWASNAIKTIFIGGKTGLLHAEALTIQNSPEFKVFPAVGGGEISHRIFVMMQQHKLCLKDANSNFKFEFSIVFPMSKTTTICGTCEHYGVVEPALSMTPS